jgi:predicted transcriptional regulator
MAKQHGRKTMTVSSICNYNVATVGPRQGVIEAAIVMRQEHVGDLIVVEQRSGRSVPVGILTDRDIVLGLAAKGVSLDAETWATR